MDLIKAEAVLKGLLEELDLTYETLFDNLNQSKEDITEALEIVLEEIEYLITRMKAKQRIPENHGNPWSESDELLLEKLFIKNFDPYNGYTFYRKASKRFKRTQKSIQGRLAGMGLIKFPYDPELAKQVLLELRHR